MSVGFLKTRDPMFYVVTVIYYGATIVHSLHEDFSTARDMVKLIRKEHNEGKNTFVISFVQPVDFCPLCGWRMKGNKGCMMGYLICNGCYIIIGSGFANFNLKRTKPWWKAVKKTEHYDLSYFDYL